MASALLPVTELKLALGVTGTTDDALYEQIIDQVQAIFEAVCNRGERPFVGAQSTRTDVFDGSGSAELFLPYAITTLTSVVIGADVTVPDETLDVSDKSVLRYAAGRNRLARVDGGTFGTEGDPRVVHVTYAAAADLPKAAKAAVLAGAKLVVNRLGSEGVSAERIGAYSVDYASAAGQDMAADPIWKLGVQASWEPRQ